MIVLRPSYWLLANHLLGLDTVGLRAEVGGGRATLEEASEKWLEERAEDDDGAAGLGKSHPEDKDELEGVVECF